MQPSLEYLKIEGRNASIKVHRYQVPSFDHSWHYHSQYELTYIHRGEGMRYVGDHVEPFGGGDLILIGKNLPHQWVSSIQDISHHSLSEATVIHFSDEILFDVPEFSAIRELIDQAKQGLKFGGNQDVVNLLKSIDSHGPLRQLTALIEILNKLCSDQNKRSLSSISFTNNDLRNPNKDRISTVRNYLLTNLEQQITVDSMALQCHMTKPSFCRWFKKTMNLSFVSYLNILRVERACQLLIRTDESISQIAYQTGFESISNFNRFFKRITYESPREYRKKRDPSGTLIT